MAEKMLIIDDEEIVLKSSDRILERSLHHQ